MPTRKCDGNVKQTCGKSRLSIFAIGAVLTALASISVHADTITIAATGSVTQVGDTNGSFNSSWKVDDIFRLTYTLDLQTPDTNIENSLGWYFGAITQFSVQIGESIYSYSRVDDSSVVIFDNHFYPTAILPPGYFVDGYSLTASQNNPLPWNVANTYFKVSMSLDTNGTTAPTDGMRGADLNSIPNPMLFSGRVATFNANLMGLDGTSFGSDYVVAQIDSVSAVPLPASAWLLLSGIAFIGRMRRKG